MNRRWIAKGAMLCACAMLMNGMTAAAEEKRLGDYIYVPAMRVEAATGSTTLRVEGLCLDAQTGEQQMLEQLAGTEFGVYVIAADGKLTPWANPLYPSEPMRLRTGEEILSFALPAGTEFYLRQESAPQGYLFDRETLIPVTGEALVVRNAMAGQLVLSAQDSQGNPVSGVRFLVTHEDGTAEEAISDENGHAVLTCVQDETVEVAQAALPQGVFAARSVTVSHPVQGEQSEGVQRVHVAPAMRSSVAFSHPASGSVELNMTLATIDANAQIVREPLADVRLDILSEPPVTVITDEQGRASASLLEGTYSVRLSYEGNEDVVLPLSEGQMIVSSGSTTLIELSASHSEGRVLLMAEGAKQAGGSATLENTLSGETYGPYPLDAEGMMVSDLLPAGSYRISAFDAPQGTQFGTMTFGEAQSEHWNDLTFDVSAGQVTQLGVRLLTRQAQTFELLRAQIDEQGTMQYEMLHEAVALTLRSRAGEAIETLENADGYVSVEALSGEYTLEMEERDAKKLGVLPVSAVFALPGDMTGVVFHADHTRLVIASVDENGTSVAGAVHSIEDSKGKCHTVKGDQDGMAVTEPVALGEVSIESVQAPQEHAKPQEPVIAMAQAGEAQRVEVMYPSFGTAQLSVSIQSLDEQGGMQRTPFAGMRIHLYRVAQDGHEMKDTGIVLVSDENGSAQIRLEAGEYVAKVDAEGMERGIGAADAVRFVLEDMKTAQGELVCMDERGGVRVRLTGGELDDAALAQVRFELTAQDARTHQLAVKDGVLYAGDLPAGTYVLRQLQMPQGYTLAAERTVTVAGGEVTEVNVPLEEYAVVTVSKTGLTFDDALKTYVVPLSGEYGVYTMENGEMKPYPTADKQVTLWANVTPQQIAQGKAASAKLPASIEGTTYYLHETGAAQGFAADENYYEMLLRAGEQQTLHTAVSSDRGFFSFDMLDGSTGERVVGGSYELIDPAGEEVILSFEMGEEAYRNAMAIPVGSYVLRQKEAAEGYALSMQPEIMLEVQPYLTQGGTVTEAMAWSSRIPQTAELSMPMELYASEEHGLTLLTADMGALDRGEMLLAPTLTIMTGAAGIERSDIASVVLSGVRDAQGGSYRARVEYCLDGGGWQPSDARETDVLDGPTAVSLDDVQDDICAVRVTYMDAQTGEEAVQGGFAPGQVALSIQASAEGALNMTAEASFEGVYAYRQAFEAKEQKLPRSRQTALAYTMQADGMFDTVCAGRDGRIGGIAFFDEDADGVMDASETGRYAGMTVTLLTKSGDVVDTSRTAADGSYAFETLSSGEYQVQFDSGDRMIFSSGDTYSAHVTSGVTDERAGTSGVMGIDGDRTDYVVHAGCMYAAQLSGRISELLADDIVSGMGGLSVELYEKYADEDDEPAIVVTDDQGMFAFSRILGGEYRLRIELPQGYLFAEAEDGVIEQKVLLDQGEEAWLGGAEGFVGQRAASVSGMVRIDDDGDGVIGQEASGLSGVRVALLRAQNGHTEQIAETTTDERGVYRFDQVYAGEYSVLFSLEGEWAFTRYGADSAVYGAVSQSGSTQTFTLAPGDARADLNAGVTIPAQLSVSVFQDTQYDGQKGVYEKMLSDVSVSLIRLENGEDAEEITYKTDAEGGVFFAGVSPGEYVLAYQMPGQWRATRQVDPTTTNYPVSFVPQSALSSGRSEPFTLSMGQSGVRLYIGAMLSGSISGTVYYDNDADAQFTAEETVCAGVKVELLDSEQNQIAKTTSGEDGSYAFEGLAPGRYVVRFTAESGCGFSGTARTAARGCVQQSDTNVSTTKYITVSNGSATETADAGVVRLASISGMIWEDMNGDRIAGEGENGMAGLTVNLMNGAGRNILKKAMTDEAGRFVLDHLQPGTYKLRVDGPDGYVFSGEMDGSALPLESQRDSMGYSAEFTLLGGAHVEGLGFGLLTQGVISGKVWNDADYDGVMGANESGLRGATVALIDRDGFEVASVKTIRSGEFVFEKLMPGSYSIRVTLDEGYLFTAEGADSAAKHADGSVSTVELSELPMGGSISQIHVGALKPAVVGGVVWYDQDDDGRRQQDDTGMSGIRVVLEMTSGADAGSMMETYTDESGAYTFEGVMPGSAVVSFELQDGYAFARNASGSRRVSSVPKTDACTAKTAQFAVASGESRTDIDAGVVGVGTVSGMVWEDGTYNGMQDGSERGVAGATITLMDAASGKPVSSVVTDESGTYSIGFVRRGEYSLRAALPQGMIFTRGGESAIADVDSAEAATAAFSLAMGEGRSGLDVGVIEPARICGNLIVDDNENGYMDDGEVGHVGAVVTAMQGGTAVASVRTQEDGSYAFETLRPGTYRLRIALEQGALFSEQSQLRLTNPDALEGETGEYVLEMGSRQTVEPVMVVLAAKIAGRAWMDADVNGAMDAGEAVMTGVMAELLDEAGTVISSVAVDGSGQYSFDQLRSGTYSVRFTLPAEVLFTDVNGEAEGSCVPVVPGSIGTTAAFALTMGEQRLTMNVGGILPGKIGDTVWLDVNGNGLQDYKEPLIPGVRLTLLRVLDDGSLTETMTVQSDKYGYYSMESLRPGTYVLRLDVENGTRPTIHFGEPLGEIDSDLNPESGMSDPLLLKSGQTLRNIDVGLAGE